MRTGVKKRGYVSVLRERPGRTAMEMATTPMTERRRKYRESHRERAAGWYNGWLHILLIYTAGFTALYVAARDMVRPDPAIKRNRVSAARKSFAASLALAGALLSQSAGAEERLIKGFDAVRACSGDIEKLCSGVERRKFRTKVLDADLRVTPPSGRLAIIMQDEFRNTYDSCGC